jgi:very-short-patch-repair endonuclease
VNRDRTATQSDLEDRFLNLLRRHRVPRPVTQRVLGENRVDFHWPEQRLVVEVDGWRGHGTRSAFQADRTATNALQLSGQLVLRFTDDDVDYRGRFVADQVRAGLRRHA